MEIPKKKTIFATQSLMNLSSLKTPPKTPSLDPQTKKIHKQNPTFLTNSRFFHQMLTKKVESKGPISFYYKNIREIAETLSNILDKSDKSRVYFPEELMSCIYTIFKNPNSFSSENVENLPLIQKNPNNNVPLSSIFPNSDATKDFQYQWLEILVKRQFEEKNEEKNLIFKEKNNGFIQRNSNEIINNLSENLKNSPEKSKNIQKNTQNHRNYRTITMQNPKSFENLSKIIKIESSKLAKLFFQCSENLRNFMNFLKTKEKKLLWSDLEDKVLRIGKENNELAWELLRFYKGDERKLKEREQFLKKFDEKSNNFI